MSINTLHFSHVYTLLSLSGFSVGPTGNSAGILHFSAFFAPNKLFKLLMVHHKLTTAAWAVVLFYLDYIILKIRVNVSSLLIFCLFIVQSRRRNRKGIAALFLSLFRRGLSPRP